jgi:hypothetical protein
MKASTRDMAGHLLRLALWAGGCLAQAQLPQVQVPGVEVPAVPTGPVVRELGDTLRGVPARVARIDRLLARHRAELERDPRGELVIRAQVLAIDASESALARARDDGFPVRRIIDLPDLGLRVAVLGAPPGMSAARALRRLRKLDPAGAYEYNHVYLDAGPARPAAAQLALPAARVAERVGLIDSGVDPAHAALTGAPLERFGCDGRVVPGAHGTAVASLLVAQGAGAIFAADVYCGAPTGGAVDSVAAALGWMARERVGVINVSLVGPRNALLERAVKSILARGHLVVAAVGNDGPAARPLYPAAIAGVIGVTAVDGRHRVLVEACRGPHVAFAALGVHAGQPPLRGTSFAAPKVAVLLASRLATPDPAAARTAVEDLRSRARDLGRPGPDEVYGFGEVGNNVL